MRKAKAVAPGASDQLSESEIAHLRDLDIKGLQARWKNQFRQQSPTHLPRHLLFGVLAYRIQADKFGDLAPDTIRLLKQIATNSSAKRTVQLTAEFDRRQVKLKPGTILMREWNGRPHRVAVVDEGFSWNGKTHDSLSKAALAITGTKWNGPRFFGLRDQVSPVADQ